MVIIRFHHPPDWYYPNWMFRQLVDDVIASFPDQADLHHELKKAEALGALFLDELDSDLAARVARSLRVVAERTVKGEIKGWKGGKPADEKGHQWYDESLHELLKLLGTRGQVD